MAKSSIEVVFEGWLTKSPPTKRIWRARWRRRWFALTSSGEIPGQFVLTYYADRNCRKLKGSIDLDHCEQVDLGLKLEERKLKFDHVFDIKTPTRTYYLAADSEAEMKSWVTCICKVCGLKSTTEEEDLRIDNATSDVEVYVEEEKSDKPSTVENTPPISPVSTSPYIPISECITGRSPYFDQDFKTLLQHNIKNSIFKNDFPQMNQAYELPQRNYINYVNDMQDPRFYDTPRQLVPPPPPPSSAPSSLQQQRTDEKDEKNSPLQSPTDSESVFTDEDWVHNTSSDLNNSNSNNKKLRASDSSTDVDVIVTQKFTKDNNCDCVEETTTTTTTTTKAPPRPPKSLNITTNSTNYLNINAVSKEICLEDKSQLKILSDDMYDFPRSHQLDSEPVRLNNNTLIRRHCYNNAAPSTIKIDGQIFSYDISPKPGTSNTTQIFRYDLDDIQDEPASPLSQSSSTTGYSNLPSPLLTDSQMMPPPIVNRDLKPKRKLSDSLSMSSNPEPPSPRGAPSVDRKLKPPTPLQEAHMRKNYSGEESSKKLNPSPTHRRNFDDHRRNLSIDEDQRRIRAAPSPTPPTLGRSHESLLFQTNDTEEIYQYLPGKMQYLDLDLDCGPSSFSNGTNTLPLRSIVSNTVYKKVDFMKTQAFNITRNNLEKERQEPPVSFSKK